ncbi:anoctamin-9 isoform X2 [Narcine bancroftii]|uniref:anoctamin-9 isoform X2 n=1 Tax=Narcine bancroftii TaxID=1343680 RepID=UPI0038320278
MEQNEMINIVPTNEEEHLLIEDYNMEDNIDFVFVVKKTLNALEKNRVNRQRYLRNLSEKGFRIMKKEDAQNLYFGIQACENIFDKYIHHLNISQRRYDCKMTTVSKSTRVRIINFILSKTRYSTNDGQNEDDLYASNSLQNLLKDGAFQAAFPLHEKDKKEGKLHRDWAKWKYLFEKQPINEISKEICNASGIIMCPLCDQRCRYWRLNETCSYAKVTQLFDHEITVLFAMIMAIWATVFLEIWKRARAKTVCSWELYHWDEDEEDLVLGLIYNPNVPHKEYHHSYKHTTIVMLLACVLLTIIIGIALGIVICRVIVAVLFTKSSSEFLSDHASTAAVMVGALLHFFTILIMTKINRKVAEKLCELERPRTALAKENSFTVKMFTFQFFTMFSSIFYIAFFLGRINGHPKNYVRIAREWRLEECHPSGCMTDLFIQMAVVMILKQILSSCVEYAVPSLKHQWKKCHKKLQKEDVEDGNKDHWVKNYSLNSVDSFSLFNEFLEMAIQYSFTTIFVAAFPLAPLLALVNNLFEIRLDARKMLLLQRRPIPRKAKDIGIWVKILEAVGVLAVIGNGLVISITSDFIPQLVYRYEYGPCAGGQSSVDNCLMGYVNNSLSVFYVKDFENETRLKDNGSESLGFQVNYCRYRDYRTADDYEYSIQFWHIFAARLGFLILFENVVVFIKYITAWFVPDLPTSVTNENLHQTYKRLQNELQMTSREIREKRSLKVWRSQSTSV